jgi:hypothetical protein
MTSMPWLKIAPKLGGQARRQASQLMHSDMSMYIGALGHFGLRSRFSIRESRAGLFPDAIYRILRGAIGYGPARTQSTEGYCWEGTHKNTAAPGGNMVPAGGSDP